MSLSENLDDVFDLLKVADKTIVLQAFDVFSKFPQELVNDFLLRDDCAKARVLIDIISTLNMVNIGLLDTIVMIAATEKCAKLVAENEKVVQRIFSLAKHGDPVAFVLPLTQVSRMAPEQLHKTLFKLHGNYLKLLTDTFNACDGGTKQADRLTNIAYVFLNVTQLKAACEQLFSSVEDIAVLSSFIRNPAAILGFKCIVAKILLNTSYHLEMHHILLNDQIVADLADPFADEDDDISTEEMDKLPLQLQYVDHKRSQSTTLLETIVEILAQLCTSKTGREKLRSLGIYVILREFDKARRGNDVQLVDGRFMTLEGTPEWNLLMNTLLFSDQELQAGGDDESKQPRMPDGVTEFNLEDLDRELKSIEHENHAKKIDPTNEGPVAKQDV